MIIIILNSNIFHLSINFIDSNNHINFDKVLDFTL